MLGNFDWALTSTLISSSKEIYRNGPSTKRMIFIVLKGGAFRDLLRDFVAKEIKLDCDRCNEDGKILWG